MSAALMTTHHGAVTSVWARRAAVRRLTRASVSWEP